MILLRFGKGGMSFHGALIGIIIGTSFILYKGEIAYRLFFYLDIIACVSPIGIFLGRIANFVNGELVGKVTNVYMGSVIFQLQLIIYQDILHNYTKRCSRVLVLFILLNSFIFY